MSLVKVRSYLSRTSPNPMTDVIFFLAYRILAPQSRIQPPGMSQNLFFFGHAMWHVGSYFCNLGLNPKSPAVEMRSLNHWTARKSLKQLVSAG